MAHMFQVIDKREAAEGLARALGRAGIDSLILPDPLVVLVAGMPSVNVRIEWFGPSYGYGYQWRQADRPDPDDHGWQWDACPVTDPSEVVRRIAPYHPSARPTPPQPQWPHQQRQQPQQPQHERPHTEWAPHNWPPLTAARSAPPPPLPRRARHGQYAPAGYAA